MNLFSGVPALCRQLVRPACWAVFINTTGPSFTKPPAVIGRWFESKVAGKTPPVAIPPLPDLEGVAWLQLSDVPKTKARPESKTAGLFRNTENGISFAAKVYPQKQSLRNRWPPKYPDNPGENHGIQAEYTA